MQIIQMSGDSINDSPGRDEKRERNLTFSPMIDRSSFMSHHFRQLVCVLRAHLGIDCFGLLHVPSIESICVDLAVTSSSVYCMHCMSNRHQKMCSIIFYCGQGQR